MAHSPTTSIAQLAADLVSQSGAAVDAFGRAAGIVVLRDAEDDLTLLIADLSFEAHDQYIRDVYLAARALCRHDREQALIAAAAKAKEA